MPQRKKSKKDKKDQVCRICISATNDNRVVFEVDSKWSQMLDYCFGFTVLPKIGPRVLCKKCSDKVKEFSDFKDLALKSEELWTNSLVAQEDKPKEETVEIKNENIDLEPFQDEYLEVDFTTDYNVSNNDSNDEIKEDEKEESKLDIPVLKKEISDEKKGNKDFEGLSEKQFTKKFFHAYKDKKEKYERTHYECLKCGDIFKRRSHLPEHVQTCYESEVLVVKPKETKPNVPPDIFYCGLCSFNDPDENTTVQHVKVHHCLANDLNCKLCNYTGRDIADIVFHRYKHLPDVKFRGKYRCPHCDKIRLNELSLQFHYRVVHLNKKAGGWCSVCNKTFTGYIYFRNHERLHKNAKYICDFCGAKFLFRNLIVAHIKEHMNVRNYVCDTCGKAFKRGNALSGHIRACHTEHKSVPCDHCGKHFKNQHSLKLHMKLVRKGNNYICDVCCKGHATLSLLKKHMFWHTGERPFSCETCGGKFKSKGNLKLHMRKHMGIYPFKCDSCEKQFMTSTQLKAHSSVHTGIRRVKCLVCEKTFHEKRQMIAHCRAKHDSMLFKNEGEGTSLLPNTSLVSGALAGSSLMPGASLVPPQGSVLV